MMTYAQRFAVAFATFLIVTLAFYLYRRYHADKDKKLAALSNLADVGRTLSSGFGQLPDDVPATQLYWQTNQRDKSIGGISPQRLAYTLNLPVHPAPLIPTPMSLTDEGAQPMLPPNRAAKFPCPQGVASDGVTTGGVARYLQPGPCAYSSYVCAASEQL
jgi:hypothetical protein